MALIFSPSIATLLSGAGILKSMGLTETIQDGGGTFPSITPSVNVAVTVYDGIQPSAATITSNWTSYRTSFLFHQSGINFTQPNWNSPTTGGTITLTAVPTAVTATNTGTASWAIIWCSNIAAGTGVGQVSSSTISNTSFIVAPVTVGSGNGVLKLSTLTVTGGTSVTIQSANLAFTL